MGKSSAFTRQDFQHGVKLQFNIDVFDMEFYEMRPNKRIRAFFRQRNHP
jgi:hypothetical protein